MPQKGTYKRKSALFAKEENLESRKELGNAIVLTELRDMLNMILNTNHSNRSKGTLSPIDDE